MTDDDNQELLRRAAARLEGMARGAPRGRAAHLQSLAEQLRLVAGAEYAVPAKRGLKAADGDDVGAGGHGERSRLRSREESTTITHMPEAPPQDLIAHSQKKKLGRPIVEHQGHPFHEALAERGMNVAKWARTRNYVSSDGKVSGRVYNWLSRGFPADVAAEIKKDFGIDVPVSAEPSKKPKTRHS